MLPYENEEPASDITRASANREEYVTSPAAPSPELDFFGSSFDIMMATQMLGDGRIHSHHEDPWQHSVTTLLPREWIHSPLANTLGSAGTMPRTLKWYSGAIFAVRKEAILARERSFWQRILTFFEERAEINGEEGHFMERMWCGLLDEKYVVM
ncbi:hypothetical protein WAI453_006466 [Rhynchosporium graminicola]